MTVRIYALAKDLNVESKVLIDLCQQLGIKSISAALSNLTDDDVAKIKDHLARHPKKPAVGVTAAPAVNAPNPPSAMDSGKVSNSIPRIKSRSKQVSSDKTQNAKSKTLDSVLSNLTDDDVAKIKSRFKQLFSKKNGCRFPIRLYSLAKELEIESKVLSDLCQQLGINCRGGALTNLINDDVAKIKAHFE